MTKKKTDELEELISQADAAKLRGVSRASISELIARGRLVPVTVAGRKLLRRSDVLNFQEEKRGPKANDQ
jgi:hypothetical protein